MSALDRSLLLDGWGRGSRPMCGAIGGGLDLVGLDLGGGAGGAVLFCFL